jgi:hypothetical protein
VFTRATKQISHLLSDRLGRLGNQLLQLGIRLSKLLGILVLDVLLVLGRSVPADHDDARGSLGCAGLAELCARLDVDVWHAVVFAENRNVRDDVHGRDVGGNDDNGSRVVDVCARGLGFAQRFDDFLDTAAERLGLCGWGVVSVFCSMRSDIRGLGATYIS